MLESIDKDLGAIAYALGLQGELKPLGQIVAPQHATRKTGAMGPGGTTVAPDVQAALVPRPELPSTLPSTLPAPRYAGSADLAGGSVDGLASAGFNAPTRAKVAWG